MSRRVRHIYADYNEYIAVHRTRRSSGDGGSSGGCTTLIVIIIVLGLIGSC